MLTAVSTFRRRASLQLRQRSGKGMSATSAIPPTFAEKPEERDRCGYGTRWTGYARARIDWNYWWGSNLCGNAFRTPNRNEEISGIPDERVDRGSPTGRSEFLYTSPIVDLPRSDSRLLNKSYMITAGTEVP
jgi:hypothetical protein